jgi:methionyl-tRNA formyltransferase
MISQYQVGVVVSFGYLLPAALLDSLQAGVINMHPSLLPQYRGAAPIYHALMDGRTETGVSIVTLDAHRFDAGRILWQQRVGIAPNEQYSQLAHRLAIIGADAVLDTLRHLPARLAASVPQSGKPSRAPRLSRADARVLWHTHSTAQIWHRFCALGASFGGLHTQWRGRRLKLVELAPPDDAQLLLAAAAAASSSSDASPGTVVFDRASALLLARCRDGWVGVRRVCVEGKSAVSARQFAAGYRLVGASNDAFVDE